MEEEERVEGGPIESANRVLKELLKSTKFKATVSMLLRELDPESAPELVRTIFWEDSLFFISVATSLPAIINATVQGLEEILVQLDDFPTETLMELSRDTTEKLDGETMGEVLRRSLGLFMKFYGEETGTLKEGLANLREEISRGSRGDVDLVDVVLDLARDWIPILAERAKDPESGTGKFISGMSEAIRQNPDFLRYVLAPIVTGAPAPAEE